VMSHDDVVESMRDLHGNQGQDYPPPRPRPQPRTVIQDESDSPRPRLQRHAVRPLQPSVAPAAATESHARRMVAQPTAERNKGSNTARPLYRYDRASSQQASAMPNRYSYPRDPRVNQNAVAGPSHIASGHRRQNAVAGPSRIVAGSRRMASESEDQDLDDWRVADWSE
jgi:hypothetical protein